VKGELERVERRAQQRGRAVSGFRPGAWPDAKIAEMMRVLIGSGNPSITTGAAVMLLELDRALEDYVAAALTERESDRALEGLCDEVVSRFEHNPHAALATRIALAFKGYGGRDLMTRANDEPLPLVPKLPQQTPDALAAELVLAHVDLASATSRTTVPASVTARGRRVG
jgi:hypothetical protein